MKSAVLLVLSSLSLVSANASATEVLLNAKRVSTQANPAVLVRTASSPKEIDVSFPIVYVEPVCVQNAVREVVGQDPSCGYRTDYVYSCKDEQICRTMYKDCSESSDPFCSVFDTYQSCETISRCADYPESVMLSCKHSETYCAKIEQQNVSRARTVQIEFKNLPKLAPGQTERFELSGTAGYYSYQFAPQLKNLNTLEEYSITYEPNDYPYEIEVRRPKKK